jgi:hypothetical protein
MSISGRSSGFGVFLAFRLPVTLMTVASVEKLVTRYSGATVQDFHLLPYYTLMHPK